MFWVFFTKLAKENFKILVTKPLRMLCFAKFVANSAKNLRKKIYCLASSQVNLKCKLVRYSLLLTLLLLQSHNACEQGVRYRCCQMVNKLLYRMGDEAQIDDDLYDRIYECMLQRLRDKCPIVRVQAVFALSRLQDPNDQDCPVIDGEQRALAGCPAVREKSGKFQTWQKSGKSQGILLKVREKNDIGKSQGICI